MFWQWWRGKMEEFNKIKDEIVNKYLKDPNLHKTKKEAISIQLKLSKISYKNLCCDGHWWDQYIDTAYEEVTKQIMRDTKSEVIEILINTITDICKFENLDLLESLNDCALHCKSDCHSYFNSSFFETTFEMINELQNFINSGFDEKHYYDEIKSLQDKLKDVQKFSSTKIMLDLLPKPPTDIIRNYIFFEAGGFFKQGYNVLPLINIINSHLKFRSEGDYKITPMATKKEKQHFLASWREIANEVYGKDFDDNTLKDKKFIQQLKKDWK